jgi:putative membrane protein
LVLGLSLAGALNVGCGDDDGDDDVSDDGGRPDSGTSTTSDGGMDASTRMDGGSDGGRDAALDATTSSPDAAARITEPQVVGVTSAINAGEIQAGTLASEKAVSGPAIDFAEMMVTMHTAAQQRQSALGIAAAPSPQRTAVESAAMTAQQMLMNTPAGPGFDLAYLESQVTMHLMALELIDEVLLPSATTQALRNELTGTRAEVAMHLAQARDLVSRARDGGLPAADAGTTSTSDAGAGLDSGS